MLEKNKFNIPGICLYQQANKGYKLVSRFPILPVLLFINFQQ